MRIAFDTGGTFTDCVFLRDGRIEILKIPSTPRHPAAAFSTALKEIVRGGFDGGNLDLACGTTVGTNALLERRGGRVALVTTAGFEDVLEIGRQARPRLYDLIVRKTPPLVPSERRFGLKERLDFEGRTLLSPSRAEIDRIVRSVRRSKAESVAVCLLFSFVNPVHEKAMWQALGAAGFRVSASHEILPEYREYERISTTVVNAYLVPVMADYLAGIEKTADTHTHRITRVRVMQSNGGTLSAQAAAREPVRTILSGPAGGVLGSQYVAQLAGFDRIITFDMGGTSTDVALMGGAPTDGALPGRVSASRVSTSRGRGALPATTSETIVSDVPVAVPMLDIHTVGAGGGSIARFDRAGALRVGPESAGADPGPICYGRGEKPTVTDANLVLGRIPESGLLGGAFKLDVERARTFMDRARRSVQPAIPSVEKFAQGIVDVANAVMEKAIRVISVERGHDPHDYTLVAFGGAGGLHACDLAAALEIPRVLVPIFPGALSALGILRADVTKDLSRTVRLEARSVSEVRPKLARAFSALEDQGFRQMRAEGFPPGAVRVDRSLDIRYSGQSYELSLPFTGNFITAFHHAHEQRYGYSDKTRSCEVVTVRARFTGRTPKPNLPKLEAGGTSARPALISVSKVSIAGRRIATPVYGRARLRPGNRIAGPAIVTEYSATTLIPPGTSARVDSFGNILLQALGKKS